MKLQERVIEKFNHFSELVMFKHSIFSLPFIGSFIPNVQDYVSVGFDYLNKAPSWYQWAYMGMVAATFGLRGWIKTWKR